MNPPVFTHVCPWSPDRRFTGPRHCVKLRARAARDEYMPGRDQCLACDGPTELAEPILVEGLAPPPGVGGDKPRGGEW